MSKNYAHLLLAFIAFFASNTVSLLSQNASIQGNEFICPGTCNEYTLVAGAGGPTLTDVTWTSPGLTSQNTFGNTALICNFDGTISSFTITASGFTSNGQAVSASLDVFSSPGTIPLIDGPTAVCPGQVVTYSVSGATGSIFDWQVIGDASIVTGNSSPSVVIGTGNVGSFTVSVFSFDQNGCNTFFALDVAVVGNPQILTIGAACPPDSLGSCEQVCANTSATYEVTGVPPTTPVNWQVLGAEDFQVNGNAVTVQWGAPGQGEVSASVNGGNNTGLQVFCQQYYVISQDSTFMGYAAAFGGQLPYTYIFTGPQGYNFVGTTSYMSSVSNLSPGLYTVQVTDPNGLSGGCQFVIQDVSNQPCLINIIPEEVITPSSPNGCNGLISIFTNGLTAPATFSWSNGATSQTIEGLCCGQYNVTVTDSEGCTGSLTINLDCPQSSCSGEASLCVNILEEAKAVITSQPPAVNGTVVICQGQSVFFENESTGATSYVWDFGDFQTSASFEPEHVYNTPGMYLVSLIARNECFCSDTTFLEIYVLPAITPDLQCVGTICEGETVTYSTSVNCGTYDWTLTGSYNLLDGGGAGDNFITVEWTAGPEGTVSLEVGGCAGSVCTTPNIVPIAILSDAVQIEGKDKVCQGSTEEYFIPNYQGTEINWTVQGSGIIESGLGSNRISVHWYGAANLGNPQRVIVEFNNCYLECSGRDTLLVNIVPNFYTTGPIEICQNSNGTFQSRNAINDALMLSNWQVFNAAGTSVWTSGAATNTANIPFAFPVGKYTVRAMPASASGFCNERYDIFTEIIALPPPPTGITGLLEICPGSPYTYEASGSPLNDFTWTISGGTPATANGNPVNVIWGAAPPYTLAVSQVATTGAGCVSPPANLTVNPLPNFSITGDNSVCREESATYAAPTFENVSYDWTVLPANAGTIIAGQGTEMVEVLWHAVGNHTLGVTVCGVTKTFSVAVNPTPNPVVPDGEVCFNQTTVVTTTTPFVGYSWRNESGVTVSTGSSPSLGGGFYEVEVTNTFGCTGETTFEIVERPLPQVNISAQVYIGLCPGGPPATIVATTVEAGNYDYQWLMGATPVGTNSTQYSTDQTGTYKVVVTDQNGCTGDSKLLLLADCESAGGDCFGGLCGNGVCNGTPGDPCIDGGNISFDIVPTANCNTHNYLNTSVGDQPGSLFWEFGDPGSGVNNTSSLENPSHTFPRPGYYGILVLGAVERLGVPGSFCPDGLLVQDSILAVANFDASIACPGAPVQFTDLTERMPGITVTGWQWSFGDPASGAANSSTLQNPTHNFIATGTYSVTLTSTLPDGCTTSSTKNVVVSAPPDVIFAPPAQSCENKALAFEAIPLGDFTSVEWNFGDPGSAAGNTSSLVNTFHEFDAPGAYTVTLTAANVYGCTATFSDNVSVTPNPLTGVITLVPPSPICEGDASTLIAPAGGTTYEWSTGAVSTSIISTEAGVFSVTLTDADGCTYAPPPATLDVTQEPNGIIKAVEYNEFGQPVAFFENNYTVCEGEDVTLLVQGSTNYGYQWSNSDSGDEVSFTEDKGNLLAVGNHNFSVTVTDNLSGCTSVEGPFLVTVNPAPDVAIASVPTGYLCENNAAVLNVVSPQGGVSYAWNTSELGTSINVIAGGIYFARAINSFGCEGRSNEIEIHNAPDIDLIPTGCHTRCQPDTMCLPPQQFGTDYQWFLNGAPVAAPNGTMQNPVFTQSGVYTVAMTDVFGCTSMSGSLTLDLFTGFGEVNGTVWFDVNGNGIIDAPDTTVSGINVFLTNGGTALDTVTSNPAGDYFFTNILATNYVAVVDTAALPPGWSAILVNANVSLVGCDDEESADWLLTNNCTPTSATLTLFACSGDVAIYDGQPLAPGEELEVSGTNWLGCDSLLTVTVEGLPNTLLFVDAVACEGTFYDYNGVPVPAGTEQVFTTVNADGCLDSVIVAVAELPTDASALSLSACPGTFVTYGGMQLFPGDVEEFPLQNQSGCDSLVTVTVVAGEEDFTDIDLTTCPGGFAEYLGEQLLPGTDTMFVLTNQQGCDSLIHVVVSSASPVNYSLLATEICFTGTDGVLTAVIGGGGTAPYTVSLDGTNFQSALTFENLPGGEYTVILEDANGCRYEESTLIPVIPLMTIEADEQFIECGDSILLSPKVNSVLPITWEWLPGGSTDSVFLAKTSGIYTFRVNNACQMTENQLKVSLKDSLGDSPIYLPNGFSPNGDAINDCFRGFISDDLQLLEYELLVFDRWGNQMFETKEITGCWDGRFRDKEIDPAVFVWYIRMRIVDCDGAEREVFKEGGVTIVK